MKHNKLALESLRRINFKEVETGILNSKELTSKELIPLLLELQKAAKENLKIESLSNEELLVFTVLSNYKITIVEGYIKDIQRYTNFKINKGSTSHLMSSPLVVNPNKTLVYRNENELSIISATKFEEALVKNAFKIVDAKKLQESLTNGVKYIYETVSGRYFLLQDDTDITYDSLLADAKLEVVRRKKPAAVKKEKRIVPPNTKSIFHIVQKEDNSYALVYNDTVKDPTVKTVHSGYGTFEEMKTILSNYKS